MADKQLFGLKFPLSSEDGGFGIIDMNNNYLEQIRSELAHLIVTMKGTKLRDPEFGTGLMGYIFDMGDAKTIEDIKEDIKSAIERYLPNLSFEDLSAESENDGQVAITVKYTVRIGIKEIKDEIKIEL